MRNQPLTCPNGRASTLRTGYWNGRRIEFRVAAGKAANLLSINDSGNTNLFIRAFSNGEFDPGSG